MLATGLGALALGSCGNESARAPNPTGYDWPDSFTYRVEYVALSGRDTVPVARFEESKELHLVVRDERYLAWNDHLLKANEVRGERPAPAPPNPEDTTQFFVRLGRLGEIVRSVPACDPAVPACQAVLPSAMSFELRRIIPRLPVWWPPKGHEWDDTLAYDDVPRAGGARGSVITSYRASRDTVIAGRGYWIVTWSSVRYAYRTSPAGQVVAYPPVEERGAVYVDKERLIPVFAGWFGAVTPPPELRSAGITRTDFRGRALLAGSALDSLARTP